MMLILLSGNHILRTTALVHSKLSFYLHVTIFMSLSLFSLWSHFCCSLCLRKSLASTAHIQQKVLKFIDIYHASEVGQSDTVWNNTFPRQAWLLILSTPLIMYSLASRCCFDFPPFLTHSLVLTSSLSYYSLLLPRGYFYLHDLITNLFESRGLCLIYLLLQHKT